MPARYEFSVDDVYNVFGGGHAYRVSLYKNGKRVNYWDYDSSFGIGGALAKRKIKRLKAIYGAQRVG